MLLLSFPAWPVPGLINYQGKLTDPNGVFLNGSYDMKFYLYNAESDGNPLWNEQQEVTVTNGIYNVELGKISSLPSDLFDNEDLFLEVEIFKMVIGWETLSPRQRLTSTPFAIKAASSNIAGDADTVDGIHAADLEESNEIDEDIAAHLAIPDAHHIKTTNFAELADMATDEQIPDDITVNFAATAGDAEKLDGKDSSEFGDGHSLDAADGSPVDAVYVNNEGNVGIGTTNPQAKLHVSEPWVLGISNSLLPVWWGKGINGWLTSSSGILYEGGGTVCAHQFSAYGGGDIVRFGTSVGRAQEPGIKVVITNTGNVGIGTSNPQAMLEISGSGGTIEGEDNVRLRLSTTEVTEIAPGIEFNNIDNDSGGVKLSKLIARDSSAFTFEYGAPNDMGEEFQLMTIKTNGNVGIGTSNPQGKLDVNGSIFQRGSQLHADYVFEPNYKLESIEEHAKFMWKEKHLKAIPKVKVDENGKEIVEIGSHQRGIVEELEKAHIYIEKLYKQNKKMEERIAKLEEKLAKAEGSNIAQ